MENLYFDGTTGSIIVDGDKIEIKRAKAFKDYPDKVVHISELQGIEFKGNSFMSTTKGYIKLLIPTTQVTSRGLFQTWNDLMDENKIYFSSKQEEAALTFKDKLEKYLFDYKNGNLNIIKNLQYSSNNASYIDRENSSHADIKNIDQLTTTQKNDLIEFIDIQLSNTDYGEIVRLQKSYFGTSSLAYMKYILPDVEGFTSLALYKEQITDIQKLLTNSSYENATKEQLKKDEKDTNISDIDEITVQLIKYKELMEKGLIDEDEYKKKKAQLLGI